MILNGILTYVYLLEIIILIDCLGVVPDYNREEANSHRNLYLIDHGQNCGQSLSRRIVGGKEANLGEYPWMAKITYMKVNPHGSSYESLCGGVIINNLYVLSAAHCVNHLNKSTRVTVGEHRISTDPDCELDVCAPPAQHIEVESVVVHERYNPHKWGNLAPYDISLYRLSSPIQFNDFVDPICLPTHPVDVTAQWGEAAGWGMLENDETPDVLQHVRSQVLSHESCELKYRVVAERLYNITNATMDTQICAGDIDGEGSCQGDSGGPLMIPLDFDGIPRYYVIGVVSFGNVDCRFFPSFYTDVSMFVNWILSKIKP